MEKDKIHSKVAKEHYIADQKDWGRFISPT